MPATLGSHRGPPADGQGAHSPPDSTQSRAGTSRWRARAVAVTSGDLAWRVALTLVGGVIRFVALGPVPELGGEVRSWLLSKVCGNVECLLVSQGVLLAAGHVGFGKGGGGVQPSHPRSNIEGFRAPERGEQVLTIRS